MLSGFGPIFQVITRVGAIGAKLGGICATAFGIRQIWHAAGEEQSWKSKTCLSALYALHMGSISLTTAVLFGATDVSAPVATAIVCSTALLKSMADLFVEKSNQMGLARKHWDLEQQLNNNNNDFHTNLTLIEDLKETDDAIDTLQKELQEYSHFLKLTRRQSTLETVWNTIKDQEELKVAKNKTIVNYFAKIELEKFDPEVAIKTLLAKASQLSADGNQHKLAEIGVIQLQCIKYKRFLTILKEINSLIGTLPPGAHSAKNDYLLARKFELESRLQKFKQGGIECLPDGFIAKMQMKKGATFKKALQQYLKNRITGLDQRITQQQVLLVQKKYFLCRPIDFSPLVEQVKDISLMQNKLWLAKLNQDAKSKNVDFGGMSALLALVLALIPTADVSHYLKPFMLTIGVVAGVVSLADLYRRYQAVNKMSENETRKLKQFIVQKKFQIAKIGDAQLRSILTAQLENILQDNHSVPIISEQLVINQARVAKLSAKKLISAQLQTELPVLKVRTRFISSRR
jgi:hypothetical protein